MPKKIRDVVYGFIELDDQECEIIDHPAFQRLRRIKQLSLTDMVYPGATHTRFEHSIGVMQMATDMFNSIVANSGKLLEEAFSLNQAGIQTCRKIVRLAALLHDVGHAPFSHSGEDLLPIVESGSNVNKRLEHEQYSIAIIKSKFKKLIEEHQINNNYAITVEDITLLLGDTTVKPKRMSLLWKELISGQLDADRADYLLRDSAHLGVKYGLYDRSRLVTCMAVAKTETDALTIAVQDKAWHIAESLVLARYQMFSQVYFHKVRRIYDYHIAKATKEVLTKLGLPNGCYPSLDKIDDYLVFDDWKINNAIKDGLGGEHGEIVLNRRHYKCIDKTQIISTPEEDERILHLQDEYKDKQHYLDDKASTMWYKSDKDIWISNENNSVQPLSEKSSIVKSMIERPTQKRFYVERTIA